MLVSRLALITLAFTASQSFANGSGLEVNTEVERVTELQKARSMGEAIDLMTPDELAKEMGLAVDQQFGDSPTASEDLFTPIADGDYEVYINVSIASQRLSIEYPGGGWTTKISSGRKGYGTKRGCFRPYRLAKMHYSKKYDNSPMPHSLFYYGGFAIHGTEYERNLGRPASHGCIRVSRRDAREMFQIVKYYGANNTLICVR